MKLSELNEIKEPPKPEHTIHTERGSYMVSIPGSGQRKVYRDVDAHLGATGGE